jgi:hypothetical protein
LEPERLSLQGVLTGGITYELVSAGLDYGDASSIRLDGVEYSVNNRGLNFVVLDTETGEVVDSVCFDTCIGLQASRNWEFLKIH